MPAEEMLGDFHAIDKSLNDNYIAHLNLITIKRKSGDTHVPPLTKSVYTPRTLLAAHSHVDQPTPAIAAITENPNATGMSAEQKGPDNVIT